MADIDQEIQEIIEYKKKNGYTVTAFHSKSNNNNQNINAFDYNNKYLNGGK